MTYSGKELTPPHGKIKKPPTASSVVPGYVPDLDKDISFLEEMSETFKKIKNGNGWDRMQMDHLGIMISDWLNELKQIRAI